MSSQMLDQIAVCLLSTAEMKKLDLNYDRDKGQVYITPWIELARAAIMAFDRPSPALLGRVSELAKSHANHLIVRTDWCQALREESEK